MNLIGKRFGRLEVVSNANKHGYVSCKCDCGNFKDIRATSLTKKYQPTRSTLKNRFQIIENSIQISVLLYVTNQKITHPDIKVFRGVRVRACGKHIFQSTTREYILDAITILMMPLKLE